MKRMTIAAAVGMAVMGGMGVEGWGGVVEDAYLRGYLQAVVERELGLKGVRVQVEEGLVRIEGERLSEEQRREIEARLREVAGVQVVKWGQSEERTGSLKNQEQRDSQAVVRAENEEEQESTKEEQRGRGQAKQREDRTLREGVEGKAELVEAAEAEGVGWFPRGRAMEPVLADPRWPHFSAAWHRYQGDPRLDNVATVSFGETISFYRGEGPGWLGGRWDFVIQPGVFAFFDLDSESMDLQNADYFIGGGLVWRNEQWTVLGRVFHQSSHLGDEYILHHGIGPAERINLSYECAHMLVFFEPDEVWRIYGGGGVLFDEDPPGLPQWTVEYGLEFRSPWTLWEGRLRPVAAVDVKHWEYADWDPDVSVRAGVDLSARSRHRLLLMVEYYNGHSPNGQFFSQTIRYVGVGLHFYY